MNFDSPQILETGAGNSTICFLLSDPRRVISIAPDHELFARIKHYCHNHRVSMSRLEMCTDKSEWVLPRLAQKYRRREPFIDFALIDGCHNWPLVFLDFYYINHMLKAGGCIMIDDLQLHSVKELARMLAEEEDFVLELDLGKTQIYRRTSRSRSLGEWNSVSYILRKSEEYSRNQNPYAL